jgi:uncharacterized phage-associated protein
MATVDQVADFIISSAHEVGEPITNLKLQKLVYYAQAWHLAFYDDPLFDERLEAWVHGPVCPPLYGRFKEFGWNPIPTPVDPPKLAVNVVGHLENVIEVYGGMSAWDLERLSHTEQPWLVARGNLPPDASCSREISRDVMRDFFRGKLAEANDG